jgi:uncharacterized protein (TIGR00369 family)
MTSKTIRNDQHCFCCGTANSRGLGLKYSYPAEGKAETSLTIPDYFTGWKDLTHGGFISMLLDETMAHACLSRGQQGVTAELTVRFKKPLPVGTAIFAAGTAADAKGRIILTEAEIRDSDGTVYATGSAKFLAASGPARS